MSTFFTRFTEILLFFIFLLNFSIGIPFFITNNFYGNKLFYPALNSHQRTVKYVFGRLPWLKPNFFSVKTRSAVKSVFLNDFRQTRTKLYWTYYERAIV